MIQVNLFLISIMLETTLTNIELCVLVHDSTVFMMGLEVWLYELVRIEDFIDQVS